MVPSLLPKPWYDSAALVGVLTLAGVGLTLFFNNRRMKQELEFNRVKLKTELDAAAQEAHRERITAARKEVYNELVTRFAVVANLLGELPSIDIKDRPDYAASMAELTATVNKTWLVSEVDTARQVREAHMRTDEVFLEAVAKLQPMQKLKDALKGVNEALHDTDTRMKLLLEQVRANAVGTPTGGVLDNLQKMIDVENNTFAGLHKARDQHREEHQRLANEYVAWVVPAVEPIIKGIQDFMYLARVELGVGGDIKILQQQTDQLVSRMTNSMQGLVNRLKAEGANRKA